MKSILVPASLLFSVSLPQLQQQDINAISILFPINSKIQGLLSMQHFSLNSSDCKLKLVCSLENLEPEKIYNMNIFQFGDLTQPQNLGYKVLKDDIQIKSDERGISYSCQKISHDQLINIQQDENLFGRGVAIFDENSELVSMGIVGMSKEFKNLEAQ